MTRWEKLSQVLLRVVDELRVVGSSVRHLNSEYGRSCDTLERIEKLVEETHASHQKSNRQYTELEARVSQLERAGDAAE